MQLFKLGQQDKWGYYEIEINGVVHLGEHLSSFCCGALSMHYVHMCGVVLLEVVAVLKLHGKAGQAEG